VTAVCFPVHPFIKVRGLVVAVNRDDERETDGGLGGGSL